MKTKIIIFLIFFSCFGLFGLEYEVSYLEGYPVVRKPGGVENDLDVGDIVKSGDTIITAEEEVVELISGDLKINIAEESVFTIYEKEEEKEEKDVLSCLFGQIVCTFEMLFGGEPDLTTNSAVCGVRGTKIALLSSTDGSSLILVEEGVVEVSAEGESVTLGQSEGVEVETGNVPGEKFQYDDFYKIADFSTWNEEKEVNILEDPIGTLLNIETSLKGYIQELKEVEPLYLDANGRLQALYEEESKIKEEEGGDAALKYHEEFVVPLMLETKYHILNIRYLALSALSLRRYVLGRVYLILKSNYITDMNNEVYTEFLKNFYRIIGDYEVSIIVKYLVEADI
jgi:hypothetical protein